MNMHCDTSRLIGEIADVGLAYPLSPPLRDIKPFAGFFDSAGNLIRDRLDERDGGGTRRELIARALLLCAVLDQGPDIEGVRLLLMRVTNRLYDDEIRIFHRPLDFFRELNISAEEILAKHTEIKKSRADNWASINDTTAGKYNLFMDGAKQALNYAVFRWGVPLALPHVLEKCAGDGDKSTALLDYLESFSSAEKMSQELKDNEKFGLGKAIGDKACHLFAKWLVSTFGITRKTGDAWGEYAFEIPYDSNAGRVLWRTGYFLRWADVQYYEKKQVIQRNQGKGGKHYLRVTNIRGIGTEQAESLRDDYNKICVDHLCTHSKRPQKMEIHRLQHIFLMRTNKTPATFDDGLIHIGRKYCLNHDAPKCESCPLNSKCEGYKSQSELITEYRT